VPVGLRDIRHLSFFRQDFKCSSKSRFISHVNASFACFNFQPMDLQF
jgi:hypothetical protein